MIRGHWPIKNEPPFERFRDPSSASLRVGEILTGTVGTCRSGEKYLGYKIACQRTPMNIPVTSKTINVKKNEPATAY